ncbi:hypothetical protein BJP25_31275 [Actinokineospora bangkokensis]|uniref:Oxidoreductase n=1 Tax=Actinokineospora bangkokensis TaxID=1193682 RepID=A0A1Q9LGT2_9PSEU|nr:hypothetical protein BJP25_31275 [Actinokineospora bangkokensis]
MPPAQLTDTEREVRAAFATGTAVDLAGRADRSVRGELLTGLLLGAYPLDEGAMPALRVDNALVTGEFELEGRTVGHLVSLHGCAFERPLDLRMAQLVALNLRGCEVPGLRGRNLRVGSDLRLELGFRCTGVVDLTDATIAGTLRLSGAALHHPEGVALRAERLRTSGSVQAVALEVDGELLLSGADVGGGLHLSDAELRNPGGTALEATGLTVTDSLHCDNGFSAAGTVRFAGARVGGDAVFSTARLTDPPARGSRVLVHVPDAEATLLDADRVRVEGDLRLDRGFTARGAVGLRGAHIGGHLLLSGAVLGHPEDAADLARAFAEGRAEDTVPLALVADGVEVLGDVEARGPVRGRPQGALRAYGQVRLVDGVVHGSASLSRARLRAAGRDALFADRLRVGGTLFLRRARISGSVRLQNATIGSSLDCSGAWLIKPRLRPEGTVKPSLDARVATIGKDLLCSRGFRATGGVRVRLAEVGKRVTFAGARLGGATKPGHPVPEKALQAYGLSTQELVLLFRPGRPPAGLVNLSRATAASVVDGPGLWAARGGVLLEDFTYSAISAVPEVSVRQRLAWLRAVQPDFAPGPYEQLAAVYSQGGEEEMAQVVQVERQRRRYSELHWAGQVWGRLQEFTVGYGYRPWLAIVWLAGFWGVGLLWFAGHRMQRLNTDTEPVWNAPLLVTDLLLPIIDLGQDNMWKMTGPSQWIAGTLIAVGWILATTVAAGATRVLKRG